MSMYQTEVFKTMTSIQKHLKLYASGLWECPTTRMLLTLEEQPLTHEDADAVRQESIDSYNEWCEQYNSSFTAA